VKVNAEYVKGVEVKYSVVLHGTDILARVNTVRGGVFGKCKKVSTKWCPALHGAKNMHFSNHQQICTRFGYHIFHFILQTRSDNCVKMISFAHFLTTHIRIFD
jgi:hypothetical protein